MKKEEIEKIVAIRAHVIGCYKSLDGSSSVGTAIIKQSQVAFEYEKIIQMLDTILEGHVKFS